MFWDRKTMGEGGEEDIQRSFVSDKTNIGMEVGWMDGHVLGQKVRGGRQNLNAI